MLFLLLPFLPYLLKISNHAPIIFLGLVSLISGVIIGFLPIIGFVGYLFYFIFFCMCLWALYDFIRYNLFKTFESLSVPPSNEKLNPIEIMKKRISNRAFKRMYLTKSDEEYVKRLIKDAEKPNDMEILYLKKAFKRCTFITDSWQFLVCVVPKKYNNEHLISVGRILQGVILDCVKVGIATCWVGGFRGGEIHSALSSFNPKKDHVAVLVALGYASVYHPFAISSSYKFSRNRKPFKDIFYEDEFGKALSMSSLGNDLLRTVIEATRAAPTASNAQDVRVLKVGNSFHFYKVGLSNYYGVMNSGIYSSNWERSCSFVGLEGEFVKDDPHIEECEEGTLYMFTWKMNNKIE